MPYDAELVAGVAAADYFFGDHIYAREAGRKIIEALRFYGYEVSQELECPFDCDGCHS